MKKKTYLLLLASVFTLFFAACGPEIDIDKLSPEEAIEYLDAKIKKHPDDANLHYQRGKTLIALGKQKNHSQYFKEAINDLNKAISIDPDHAEYYIALGDAYFSIGNTGESYTALRKALQLDENNFEAHLKMGEIAYYSGNHELAMENLNKVTEQDPNNQTALFIKGFIYKEAKDTANAVFYFRKLIDLYPDYEPAYEELGMLYAQHRNKLGLEYLNTALKLQPENINVLYALGLLYQDVEEAEKANEYYAKINVLDSTFKYAWHNRGYLEMVFYEDYPNAIEFFQKALQCDPQYAEAAYNLGLAYELAGDKAKAKECYANAEKLGYKEAK